MNYSKAH